MLTLERDCIFRERNKEGFGEYDQMRERQSECGVLKSKQLPLVFGFVFGLWWLQHLSFLFFIFFIKKREKESWKLFRVLKWEWVLTTEWRYKWKEKEDINVKDDLSKSFCYYLCNQWIRWIIGDVVLNCIYYYCHANIYKFLLCIQTYLILTSFLLFLL